jgi:hypothetical protein
MHIDVLRADGEVHRTAHRRDRVRPARVPVGEVARHRHLERAEHAEVQMSPRIMANESAW